jgi:hypothetical protein
MALDHGRAWPACPLSVRIIYWPVRFKDTNLSVAQQLLACQRRKEKKAQRICGVL